jgi:hypothetical protein
MSINFDQRYIDFSLARDYPPAPPEDMPEEQPQEMASIDGMQLASGPSQTMTDAGAGRGSYAGFDPRMDMANKGQQDQMRAYDPTTRERLASFLQAGLEGLGVDRFKARQRAQTLIGGPSSNLPLTMGLADIVPLLGTGLQTEEAVRMGGEAVRSAQQGEYGTAALQAGGAALGLLPGAVGTAKVIQATKNMPVGMSTQAVGGMENVLKPPVAGMVTPQIDLQPGVNVAAGNKIGVEQDLRVKVPTQNLEMPEKPLLLLSTDEKNVGRQIENLDLIFSKFQDPTLTQDSWTKMLGYAFKSDEVPVPPYAAIKALESPENLAAPLRKLTQGQIDDASAGFKNAGQFKELYTSGKADVVTTGKLFLWSFLSRGVSPYVQEGLFMDAISGIEPFLQKAASGKFDKADLEEYLTWASTVAGKGSGQPGSGAMHNLNAFGKNFLTKLATKDAEGITGLQKVHEMMANPNMSGPQIRREFAKIGTGVGIDNKVVSFTLLVSGRDDVLVIDRVQLRNLWDDGRFAGKNLWDGRSEKKMVKQKDGTEVEKSAQIAGTALSEITYGAKGLLVYEAIERAMAQQLKNAYSLVGREGDASLGRYHWETWVAGSQQEASHGTIDAIMREAAGVPQPFKGVTAKQGEYGMYDYGAKYGVDESGPYFIYDNSKGEQYRFTVPEYRDMLTAIKDPKSGVVPKNFRVSASGNAPWFERSEVNRSKLDELIASRGLKIGDSQSGKQPVPTDGESPAANATRSRAARAKGTIVKGSAAAPEQGAN